MKCDFCNKPTCLLKYLDGKGFCPLCFLDKVGNLIQKGLARYEDGKLFIKQSRRLN